MSIKLVTEPVIVMKSTRVLTIRELISRHVISNEADSKSPKTIIWYREMLTQFLSYLENHGYQRTLSAFNVDIVRNYILFLQRRPRFQGHPFILKKRKTCFLSKQCNAM